MLYRKIQLSIENSLREGDKILALDGAHKTGKTTTLLESANNVYEKVAWVDLCEDRMGKNLFSNVHSRDDFYLILGMVCGDKLGNKKDTLVVLDNIQDCPEVFGLIKLLKKDNKYQYAICGTGLDYLFEMLNEDPTDLFDIFTMYPMDFEEFFIANGANQTAIASMKEDYIRNRALEAKKHRAVDSFFRRYLMIGGYPGAVQEYLDSKNIDAVRKIHAEIVTEFLEEGSRFLTDRKKKLQVIWDYLIQCMLSHKKRIVAKEIENREQARMYQYSKYFDYMTATGMVIPTKCVTDTEYPFKESGEKKLLKLYFADPGLLAYLIYGNDVLPFLNDEKSVQMGALYETAVACELDKHHNELFYYDNRENGSVDFLISDDLHYGAMPIVVRAGKDYSYYLASRKLLSDEKNIVKRVLVLGERQKISEKENVWQMPVYYSMFIGTVR